MQKAYNVQLELYAGGTKSTGINYVVADQETMPLYVDLLAYGKPFAIPQNAGIEMNFENPKGGTFPAMGEIVDRENGWILYEINGGDIAIDGDMTGSVTVVSGAQRLTWQMFRFYVTRSLSGGEVPPEADAPWFSQVMSEISFIKQRLDEIEAGSGGSGEGGTTLHNKLQNLSYALSGHTGFASTEQIDAINVEIVNINSRLDVLVSNDSALADEIIALSEAISNIQLTPGPQGEPGKDGVAGVTSEVFDDDVINIDNPDFDPADVLARITKLENTVGTLNTSLQARLAGAL